MKNKDGKYLETLVQLIEKSINPTAIVKHDVQMPILNSVKGATTQCDIVIIKGKHPRETITIIEVQDRSSKVKPNDFRGWKQKLDDVGAQHLICVSKQDFPESIKEQASLSGNKIHLVKLTCLEVDKLPIHLFTFKFDYTFFEVESIICKNMFVSKKEIKELNVRDEVLTPGYIKLNDKIFSFDKSELISLYVLCRDFLKPPFDKNKGADRLVFSLEGDNPVYILVCNKFVRVGFDFEFRWIHEIIDIPTSTLSYEQNEFGILAWVLEAAYDSPKGLIWLKIPIIRVGDQFAIRNMDINLPPEIKFTLSIEDNNLPQHAL